MSAATRSAVVPPVREGGQAQYVEHLVPRNAVATGLGPTREWMLMRLDEPLTLSAMAAHAGYSERSFIRRSTPRPGCHHCAGCTANACRRHAACSSARTPISKRSPRPPDSGPPPPYACTSVARSGRHRARTGRHGPQSGSRPAERRLSAHTPGRGVSRHDAQAMELERLELSTSWVRSRRSPN